MNKLKLLLLTLGFLVALVSGSAKSPNILILLADDMGSGDLGTYGGVARTPNLDALAAQGIKFNNAYSGAPNCSPARVSIVTGRMPTRSGMYSYRPPNHPMHLPDSEITIAEMLKPLGYQTVHIGKWHLSCLPQDPKLNHPQPDDQGFDYSLGTENNAEPSHFNPVNFIRNGEALGEVEGYAGLLLADEFERWFDTHHDSEKPFFVYLPFHEPHAKIVSPPELVAGYSEYSKRDAEYFASVENLDVAVGRIIADLKKRGLYDNTLIMFASDHGSYRMGSNRDFRGLKGEVYDGGLRVPLIVSFPGKFKGERILDEVVWFPDILPTIGNLVGAKIPSDRDIDGINLLPLLHGKKLPKRTEPMLWFFYRSSPEVAMRLGNFNLIARSDDSLLRTHPMADVDMPFIQNFEAKYFELYDLSKDPSQQNDLSAKMPEKLDQLKRLYVKRFKEVHQESPAWENLPPYGSMKAYHDKPKEFLRNQERFLKK
jgi:arylsulfatase A